MSPVPAEPEAVSATLGVVVLLAGVLLCFTGVRSVKLAAACVGLGLGSGLALVLGAGPVLALIVGVAAAVGAVLLVRVAVGLASFVLGALAGGVAVGSAFRALPPAAYPSPALGTLLILAGAVLCGAAVHVLQDRLLRVLTAVAGAGLVVRGVVELGPTFLGFLRAPTTWVESVVAVAAWLALAWTGLTAQRDRAGLRR
ncbi:MAG: hypothetical protein JNM77_11735 [Pseudonocardia sp.]|nr:hypothetical protein [Pseudonocardia sp.]